MTLKHTPPTRSGKNRALFFFWGTFRRQVATILVGGVLIFILFLAYLSRDLPSFDQLENYTPELATRFCGICGSGV